MRDSGAIAMKQAMHALRNRREAGRFGVFGLTRTRDGQSEMNGVAAQREMRDGLKESRLGTGLTFRW